MTQTKTATRVRTYRCVLLCTAFGDTTLYMCARLRQCLRAHAYVRLQPICVHTYAALTVRCSCVSACINVVALLLDRNRCSAHDQRPFKSRRNAPPRRDVCTNRSQPRARRIRHAELLPPETGSTREHNGNPTRTTRDPVRATALPSFSCVPGSPPQLPPASSPPPSAGPAPPSTPRRRQTRSPSR